MSMLEERLRQAGIGMKEVPVPTATSLKDIYPDDAVDTQASRWEKLLATFKNEYGSPADFVSRSPGRVNIIGEVRGNSLWGSGEELVD